MTVAIVLRAKSILPRDALRDRSREHRRNGVPDLLDAARRAANELEGIGESLQSRSVSNRSSFGCTNSRVPALVMVRLGSLANSRFNPDGAPPRFSTGVPSITRRDARRRNDSCCKCSGKSFMV